MSAMSDFMEADAFNHYLRNVASTSPAAVYLALFTSDPTDAGTGNEVSGAGYARQAITFGAPSGGSGSNTSTHEFTASGGNFGTVTHWAIFDSSVGGNMLVHGAVTTARTYNDGETATIGAGDVTVTLA